MQQFSFSPFLAATTDQKIAGSEHSGLAHIRALTPMKEATTVSNGKKMYSFGAPTASAWPSIVRIRDELQLLFQSRDNLCAEFILAFTSGVSLLAYTWAAIALARQWQAGCSVGSWKKVDAVNVAFSAQNKYSHGQLRRFTHSAMHYAHAHYFVARHTSFSCVFWFVLPVSCLSYWKLRIAEGD